MQVLRARDEAQRRQAPVLDQPVECPAQVWRVGVARAGVEKNDERHGTRSESQTLPEQVEVL